MKIRRLRVAELRQFRQPFELADISDGLNLFSGANEAGKSTLVRAIRAACFERHRSTSVDDLRPWGDGAAAPLVELDFEIDGTAYRLSKSFLQKKRCELLVGTRRLEGVEAEDFLAQLLGFQFAEKGASKDKHQGIPGLLWIEQGSAQLVRENVLHASDHLRAALDATLGEVAATGGDEIVAEVRKQREELLTDKGKPRALYLKAIEDEQTQAQQLAALEQAVAQYRQQVDQLKLLREAHDSDSREQPWLALRAQQASAQAALQAADALSGEREREHDKLRQTSGLRTLLAQRLQQAEQQLQQLATRQTAWATAVQRHEQAVQLEAEMQRIDTQASVQLQAAGAALNRARLEDNRSSLQRQLADATVRVADLTALLQGARTESERAATLQREATQLHIDADSLATLRQQHTRLNELQIRQAAVATRLRYTLQPGATLQLDGSTLSGEGEQLLLAASTLDIPGMGRLHITPGGKDLNELAQAQTRLQGEQQALLQRLGLSSLEQAETRERAQALQQAAADAAHKALKLLAPKGLDLLQADLHSAQARQAEAQRVLQQLPPTSADPGSNVTSLDSAAAAEAHARQAAEAAGRQLQAARQALAAAASQRDTAAQERDRLQAAQDDPSHLAELASQRLALLEAGTREAALQARLAQIDTQIAAARPDVIRLDIERFRRSAEIAEQLQQQRSTQILQLEATLAAAGAQGLEETLAQARVGLAQAQRRLAELRRRAQALDLLLNKLQARRQDLTRRLQAPLQKHLDRYLQLLFPNGRLQVDEQLVPGTLSRPGLPGRTSSAGIGAEAGAAIAAETGDFDSLSFGAREQMGVIARLAYADLLREAGKPTLIILDDALVHSDTQRLAQMKRVLLDAAQRHQLLLFTCHPAQWRDMGVPLRELAAPTTGT